MPFNSMRPTGFDRGQGNDPSRFDSPYTNGGALLGSEAGVDERVGFIRRTYLLLAISVMVFAAISAVFIASGFAQTLLGLVSGNRWGWVIFMVGFMGAAWFAQSLAQSETSRGVQYAGLGLFILFEALFFAPLLVVAAAVGGPGMLLTAGLATAGIFGALTLVVFATKADFSFLRIVLTLGMVAAIVAVVASLIFGFSLGIWFTVAMIFLASGYIAYDTSNILHHYRTNQHVAAALALFASVMLLFWYIIQFLMQRRE